MLSKTLAGRIIIGISLTAVLLAAGSFKATLHNGALLEVNAHLNDLMTSPHSFLLTAPEPIAGVLSSIKRLPVAFPSVKFLLLFFFEGL